MPARIVLVHDDLEFLAALEDKLRTAGHDVAAFGDSISGFDALRSPRRIEVLVTRILFQPGRPHGLSLAAAARMSRPSVKVIFIASKEMAHHAAGADRVFVMPVSLDQIVQAVEELLNRSPADGVQHSNGS